MRNKKLYVGGLIAPALLFATSLQADSLQEAITNGKVSGDVSIRYESRHFDHEVGTYYQNTAYVVPSIGVNYDTAAYNGFSVSAGFRAYTALWEDDKNSTTTYGKGDAEDRIGETDGYDHLSKLYLQYQNSGFTIQVGRKDVAWGSKDWLSKINDGVFVTYELDNLTLEALYTQRRGRVYVHELFPMAEVNNDEGMYHAAATYAINDNYKIKAYGLEAQDSHTTYGGKFFTNHEFNNGLAINSMWHYMKTSEDVLQDDTDLMEITFGGSYEGYSLTYGFVKNDDDNGFGSADNYGEIVVPFEEGDVMYEADATTHYMMLSKSIYDISLTGLYGVTEYGTENYKSSEFNLWASYGFTENISLSLAYAVTDEDSDDANYSDMQQLGATLAYTF